jgi:hypothetical protein
VTWQRLRIGVVAGALTVSAALAVYPRSQQGAAAAWWLVDLGLLALAVRGGRWARTLLTYTTTLGAVLFLLAGAAQLTSDARYFERGVALAVAAALLVLWSRRGTATAR